MVQNQHANTENSDLNSDLRQQLYPPIPVTQFSKILIVKTFIGFLFGESAAVQPVHFFISRLSEKLAQNGESDLVKREREKKKKKQPCRLSNSALKVKITKVGGMTDKLTDVREERNKEAAQDNGGP